MPTHELTLKKTKDPLYSNGKIDDIGIWGRPLLPQEILDLYNSGNLSVHENKQSSIVDVYPNPTRNTTSIRCNATLFGSRYTVYDNIEKSLLFGYINSENTELDLSNLSTGLYWIIVGEQRREAIKIIKE